ncbi:MAG: hypothetical protein ACJ8MO_11405 [Bacillus sp. (in: firmicutes)]
MAWHSGLASYSLASSYTKMLRGAFIYHPDKHQLVHYKNVLENSSIAFLRAAVLHLVLAGNIQQTVEPLLLCWEPQTSEGGFFMVGIKQEKREEGGNKQVIR